MRKQEKKQVILDFLERMTSKGLHLVDIDGFDKDMSIWSSREPNESARTLINVNMRLTRLNKNDTDVEIDKFLMDN